MSQTIKKREHLQHERLRRQAKAFLAGSRPHAARIFDQCPECGEWAWLYDSDVADEALCAECIDGLRDRVRDVL